MKFEAKVLKSIGSTESIAGTAEELSTTRQRVSTVLNNAKYILKRTCFYCERKFSPYAGQVLCDKCAPAHRRNLSLLRMVFNQSPAMCMKFLKQASEGDIKRRMQKVSM